MRHRPLKQAKKLKQTALNTSKMHKAFVVKITTSVTPPAPLSSRAGLFAIIRNNCNNYHQQTSELKVLWWLKPLSRNSQAIAVTRLHKGSIAMQQRA